MHVLPNANTILIPHDVRACVHVLPLRHNSYSYDCVIADPFVAADLTTKCSTTTFPLEKKKECQAEDPYFFFFSLVVQGVSAPEIREAVVGAYKKPSIWNR